MKYKNQIIAAILFSAMIVVGATTGYWKIDLDKCTACGACIDVCPPGAISEIEVNGEYKFTIDSTKCTDCGLCSSFCDYSAISRVDKNTAIKSSNKHGLKTVTTSVKDGELTILGVSEGTVQFFGLQGRMIAEKDVRGGECSISVADLPKGITIMSYTLNGSTFSQKISL